jgi:hypothetical protein
MSDITSGHNIAENISLIPAFSDLCGFRENEIAAPVSRIAAECRLSEEKEREASEMIRTFYNGYRFSYRTREPVYNPTLVLYFLKAFQRECEYPRRMLDSNLAADRNKIAYISGLPNGGQIILDALGEEPVSIPEVADRFGMADMLSPDKDTVFIVSLLYYFGVLTLTEKRTEMGKLVFQIPNLVIRKLYAERIREMLLPDFSDKDGVQHAAEEFYRTGSLQSLCDFIESRYFRVFDNRDYRWANELTVKTAFLTLLFSDTFYIMDSEPALERGYADMVMIVRPDMRQYELLDFLIEFKYIALGKNKLNREKIRQMSREELAALPAVKEKLKEAEKSLSKYRDILSRTYGDTLRLKVFAVVAVGFDRLVWKKIGGE